MLDLPRETAMRLPRMTVRRWMLLAAVIAAILAVQQCVERRAYYLGRAQSYRRHEHFYGLRRNQKIQSGQNAGKWIFNPDYFTADGDLKEEYVPKFKKSHNHFLALIRKYRYAADHPWIHVGPDPPEPKRDNP